MTKLLRANFARLVKDKVFWIGMAFLFGVGIFAVIQMKIDDPGSGPDQLLFIFAVFIGLVSAAFTSLYIGTEYSDGTIRNKLIVGHARKDVYLSNFITCTAASILMCLSYLAAIAALGFPLLGLPQLHVGTVLLLLLVGFLMVVASTALLTLLCMLNQSKAVSAVVCILMIVALLVIANMIQARLDAPEFYDNYVFTDSAGNATTGTTPNPQYLTGTKRDIYQFFLDFIPMGQAIQLSELEMQNPWLMALYSVLIALASTASGVLIFRKKDLK